VRYLKVNGPPLRSVRIPTVRLYHADDGPAYVTIMVIGHLGVAADGFFPRSGGATRSIPCRCPITLAAVTGRSCRVSRAAGWA